MACYLTKSTFGWIYYYTHFFPPGYCFLGLGLETFGIGAVLSLSVSSGICGRIMSYRYHWRWGERTLGVWTGGPLRSSSSTPFASFLSRVNVFSSASTLSFTDISPSTFTLVWKCWYLVISGRFLNIWPNQSDHFLNCMTSCPRLFLYLWHVLNPQVVDELITSTKWS